MAYTGLTNEGSSNFAGNNSGNPKGYAGNSFGALKYNVNSILGWVFGNPTGNDVYIYSDIVYANPNNTLTDQTFVDILNPNTIIFNYQSTTYADQVLVKILSAIMSAGDNVLNSQSLSPVQYKQMYSKSDGLLNMSFLPWNVMSVLDKTTGNYNIKTYYDGGLLNINPLKKEVLFIKLFAFLKISGISLGSYALIKYGMRKYKTD